MAHQQGGAAAAGLQGGVSLTDNGIQKLLEDTGSSSPVIVQVLGWKKREENYRVCLTDGTTEFLNCLVPKSNSELLTNGLIRQFSIIRVDTFNVIEKEKTKFLVLYKATVVAKASSKIVKQKPALASLEGPSPISLTENGVSKIFCSGKPSPLILQVLGWQEPQEEASGGSGKYRLALWDGTAKFLHCYVDPSFSSIISNGTLQQYSIIRTEKYDTYKENGIDTMILYRATVLANATAQIEMTVKKTEDEEFVPIMSAHSLMPKGVRYQVRCTAKSEKRTLSNNRGDYFVCTFMDLSGEMRMTFFQKEAERFYQQVEVRKIYTIAQPDVTPADKRFDMYAYGYQLNATSDTKISETENPSSASSIPLYYFNPLSIKTILTSPVNEKFVDVIAVCKYVQNSEKSLVLVDDSDCQILLQLSKKSHIDNLCQINRASVVLVTKAIVKYFRGQKVLSCGALLSDIIINPPNLVDTHRLKTWFNTNSYKIKFSVNSAQAQQQIQWQPLGEILDRVNANKNEELDRGFHYTTKIRIFTIETEEAMYRGCPLDSCRKELTILPDGKLLCPKCNVNLFSRQAVWRFKLQVIIKPDGSPRGTTVTCFKEAAEKLLGKSEQECAELYPDSPQFDDFSNLFDSAIGKEFVITCHVQNKTIRNELVTSHVVVDLQPVCN